MRIPASVTALEKLGRVRLSQSFYKREFLYSEIANFYGKQNIPDDPELAILVGRHLSEELLEPLNGTFGRVDGWDFKHYVLGTLLYRLISENFTSYIESESIENSRRHGYHLVEIFSATSSACGPDQHHHKESI